MEKDSQALLDIYYLLKKEKRSEKDYQILAAYLSQIPFFQKYVSNGLKLIPLECSRVLKPLILKKGEVVFQINSEGTKFYILIKGEVGLYIKRNDEDNSDTSLQGMQQVKTLSDGDSFGELGLLNYKLRSATVLCLQESYFAVIDKEDFDFLLKKVEQEILQEKIDLFVNENQIMKFSSKHSIKMMYFSAIFKKFSAGETVFKTNDSLQAMYIIKSGLFEVMNEYKSKGDGDGDLTDDQEEDDNDQKDKLKQTTLKKQESSQQKETELQIRKIKKRVAPILELGRGEMFGYEDFINKSSVYTYGVQCKENGELIMFGGVELKKLLLSDRNTLRYLIRQKNQQKSLIEKRISIINKSMQQFYQYQFETGQAKKEMEIKKMLDNSSGLKFQQVNHLFQDTPNPNPEKNNKTNVNTFNNMMNKNSSIINNNNTNGSNPTATNLNSIIKQKEQKKTKVKLKLKHYNDAMSIEFQQNLQKNFLEKFGTNDVSKLHTHMPQELVSIMNKKAKFKAPPQASLSPPKVGQSIIEYILNSPSIHQNNQFHNKNSLSMNSVNQAHNPIIIQQATLANRSPQQYASQKQMFHQIYQDLNDMQSQSQHFSKEDKSIQVIGNEFSFKQRKSENILRTISADIKSSNNQNLEGQKQMNQTHIHPFQQQDENQNQLSSKNLEKDSNNITHQNRPKTAVPINVKLLRSKLSPQNSNGFEEINNCLPQSSIFLANSNGHSHQTSSRKIHSKRLIMSMTNSPNQSKYYMNYCDLIKANGNQNKQIDQQSSLFQNCSRKNSDLILSQPHNNISNQFTSPLQQEVIISSPVISPRTVGAGKKISLQEKKIEYKFQTYKSQKTLFHQKSQSAANSINASPFGRSMIRCSYNGNSEKYLEIPQQQSGGYLLPSSHQFYQPKPMVNIEEMQQQKMQLSQSQIRLSSPNLSTDIWSKQHSQQAQDKPQNKINSYHIQKLQDSNIHPISAKPAEFLKRLLDRKWIKQINMDSYSANFNKVQLY